MEKRRGSKLDRVTEMVHATGRARHAECTLHRGNARTARRKWSAAVTTTSMLFEGDKDEDDGGGGRDGGLEEEEAAVLPTISSD